MFEDRAAAGRLLARALEHYEGTDSIVLGIPRGGVIIATEVAGALGLDLDVIIPRKIGAPGNPELAIGAVAGAGQVTLNHDLIKALGVTEDYIEDELSAQLKEIERRRYLYLGESSTLDVGNKTVLLVDDGLATGYTALAAVKVLQALKPEKIVLAVPVAPSETLARLEPEVDELICLSVPAQFFAVGQFYRQFYQVSDDEVMERIRRFRAA